MDSRDILHKKWCGPSGLHTVEQSVRSEPSELSLKMIKDEMRRQVRHRYRASDPADRIRWSESLCEKLFADPALRSAAVVTAYYPLPDEADIRPVLDRLCAQGTVVLLPQVTGNTEMCLRRYEPNGIMEQGRFDIMEPLGDLFTDTGSIDAVIVPGVAFDTHGHRLGRGKGYYDRFLEGLDAIRIGVCHPYQYFEIIPFEAHDIMMDRVLTGE